MAKQVKAIPASIERAKEWPNCGFMDNDILLIDQIGKMRMPDEARQTNFILIALCTAGHVDFRMDMQHMHVEAGDMVASSEHHIIDNYSASDDVEGMCFMVSMRLFHEIIQNVSDVSALFLYSHTYPVIRLKERDKAVFTEYFNIIRKKLNDGKSLFRHNLIRTLMLAMFYDLSNVVYHFQDHSDRRQTRADSIFTQFIKLVEENCRKERRVSWYAQQLCITPKYLSEMVKSASKRTPNDWIDNYVMSEIRVMLKCSSASIKDIAKEMNFPNQSFLGKYFKEHAGVSPSRYRKL